MTDNELTLFYINSIQYLTAKQKNYLFTYFDETNFWKNLANHRENIEKVLKKTDLDKFFIEYNLSELKNIYNNYVSQNVIIVTIINNDYPPLLKNTPEPPLALYCKGDVNLLKSFCFAVVGSRRCTKYGKEVTESFTKSLSNSGMTIVSGLADGVDSFAHNATLEVNGKTIAVLGSGLNYIYPSTNIGLAKRIIEKGGLLISEYPLNESPQTYYFPQRNRIIAGISNGVLITEATEKSGSMHTKEFALSYSRDIFAIPSRITDIYSVGCNKIIQNCQSCICLSPLDIINKYGLKPYNESKKQNVSQLSLDEDIIVNALKDGEMNFDDLLKKCNLESRKLSTYLTRLEIKGIIKKLPQNYYSI